MKKDYESPKAEKMEFNYSETVVASTTGCRYIVTKGDFNYIGCDTTFIKDMVGDKIDS